MTTPLQPLTDAELGFGCAESQQAADVLKIAYRDLRTAFEQLQAILADPNVKAAVEIYVVKRSLAWLQRHLQTCRDPSCSGCKICRCGALTMAYGFEDDLCFNCRNPPSD